MGGGINNWLAYYGELNVNILWKTYCGRNKGRSVRVVHVKMRSFSMVPSSQVGFFDMRRRYQVRVSGCYQRMRYDT